MSDLGVYQSVFRHRPRIVFWTPCRISALALLILLPLGSMLVALLAYGQVGILRKISPEHRLEFLGVSLVIFLISLLAIRSMCIRSARFSLHRQERTPLLRRRHELTQSINRAPYEAAQWIPYTSRMEDISTLTAAWLPSNRLQNDIFNNHTDLDPREQDWFTSLRQACFFMRVGDMPGWEQASLSLVRHALSLCEADEGQQLRHLQRLSVYACSHWKSDFTWMFLLAEFMKQGTPESLDYLISHLQPIFGVLDHIQIGYLQRAIVDCIDRTNLKNTNESYPALSRYSLRYLSWYQQNPMETEHNERICQISCRVLKEWRDPQCIDLIFTTIDKWITILRNDASVEIDQISAALEVCMDGLSCHRSQSSYAKSRIYNWLWTLYHDYQMTHSRKELIVPILLAYPAYDQRDLQDLFLRFAQAGRKDEASLWFSVFFTHTLLSVMPLQTEWVGEYLVACKDRPEWRSCMNTYMQDWAKVNPNCWSNWMTALIHETPRNVDLLPLVLSLGTQTAVRHYIQTIPDTELLRAIIPWVDIDWIFTEIVSAQFPNWQDLINHLDFSQSITWVRLTILANRLSLATLPAAVLHCGGVYSCSPVGFLQLQAQLSQNGHEDLVSESEIVIGQLQITTNLKTPSKSIHLDLTQVGRKAREWLQVLAFTTGLPRCITGTGAVDHGGPSRSFILELGKGLRTLLHQRGVLVEHRRGIPYFAVNKMGLHSRDVLSNYLILTDLGVLYAMLYERLQRMKAPHSEYVSTVANTLAAEYNTVIWVGPIFPYEFFQMLRTYLQKGPLGIAAHLAQSDPSYAMQYQLLMNPEDPILSTLMEVLDVSTPNEAIQEIRDWLQSYLDPVKAFLHGIQLWMFSQPDGCRLSESLWHQLQNPTTSIQDLVQDIQGAPLSADELIAQLKFDGNMNRQQVIWLEAHLRAASQEWIERWIQCITGTIGLWRPILVKNRQIPGFFSQTCFSWFDIPTRKYFQELAGVESTQSVEEQLEREKACFDALLDDWVQECSRLNIYNEGLLDEPIPVMDFVN